MNARKVLVPSERRGENEPVITECSQENPGGVFSSIKASGEGRERGGRYVSPLRRGAGAVGRREIPQGQKP